MPRLWVVTVLLVRHARAGRRDRWAGDDRLRPLSKKGRRQAEGIAELLAPWLKVDTTALVLSSPWVRCVQTLEPAAAAIGVPIIGEERLGEGMGEAASAALGGWLAERPVVVCSHGDVVNAVLRRLQADGLELGSAPASAKGSVWVLEGTTGVVERARYLRLGH